MEYFVEELYENSKTINGNVFLLPHPDGGKNVCIGYNNVRLGNENYLTKTNNIGIGESDVRSLVESDER